MSALKAQAIQTALLGDWATAISLNHAILQETPDDIDTLNRLAFAFASQGDIKGAKNIYQKVLSLDMKNPIATRNLKRLNGSNNKVAPTIFNPQMSNLFIEEPGKTKVIELINVADKKITSMLRAGELLMLSIKRMKIFVLDQQKQYVGMLPDDLSKRLIKFIEGGNTYEAYVKVIDNTHISIFMRETKRSLRYKHQSSFGPTEKTKFFFEPNTKQEKSSELAEEKDQDADSFETEEVSL